MLECKGKCDEYKIHINTANAYLKYGRCTTCSDVGKHVWISKSQIRCPCCNSILRRKPKKSEYRKKYIELNNY